MPTPSRPPLVCKFAKRTRLSFVLRILPIRPIHPRQAPPNPHFIFSLVVVSPHLQMNPHPLCSFASLQLLLIWSLLAYHFGHAWTYHFRIGNFICSGEARLARPRLQLRLIWSLLAHHLGMLGHTILVLKKNKFEGKGHLTRPRLKLVLIWSSLAHHLGMLGHTIFVLTKKKRVSW